MEKTAGVINTLSGKGLRIGIVVSRFNAGITRALLKGAENVLRKKGVKKMDVVWVPGAFEIPLMLQHLARKKKPHALIALGAVIQGETPHFEYVCRGAMEGAMQVMLQERIPVAFGVLTTITMEQALDRVGGSHGNKGEEAALVAIEMAQLTRGG